MPRYGSRGTTPVLRTAPVLAVLVCHDGEEWLPDGVVRAAARPTPRPRHVLAVDTGSLDDTPRLLSEAARGEDRVLDGVLTRDRDTGFAAAVQDAVSAAIERWGDPGGWIWVLHDDCAPDPDCLATLLTAAEASPSAGVLGPLALDWDDPRLVVEAGLSTDASGHRQTGHRSVRSGLEPARPGVRAEHRGARRAVGRHAGAPRAVGAARRLRPRDHVAARGHRLRLAREPGRQRGAVRAGGADAARARGDHAAASGRRAARVASPRSSGRRACARSS